MPLRTGDDHTGLLDFFKDRNKHRDLETAHLLYRIGSTRMVKLRKLRRIADYASEVPFGKQEAQEALEIMNEIEGLLDQVEAEIG